MTAAGISPGGIAPGRLDAFELIEAWEKWDGADVCLHCERLALLCNCGRDAVWVDIQVAAISGGEILYSPSGCANCGRPVCRKPGPGRPPKFCERFTCQRVRRDGGGRAA